MKHLLIALSILITSSGAHAAGKEYGAVAVGTDKGKIAIGLSYGLNSNKNATDAAIGRCRKSKPAGSKCTIVLRTGPGQCNYLSIGASAQGSSWGTGSNPSIAEKNCKKASRGRNACLMAFGGCND